MIGRCAPENNLLFQLPFACVSASNYCHLQFLAPWRLCASQSFLDFFLSYQKLKNKWLQKRAHGVTAAQRRREILVAKAVPLFRRYNIKRAVLFGSAIRGYCRPDSDIDLYVEPMDAERFWDFRRELEDTLDMPVDLYTDTDDAIFISKIIARGMVIYDAL